MKRKIYYAILLLLSSLATYAQSWNLVWREDFGVAEDSTIRDFTDPNISVPQHTFPGECGIINDGTYGIANSTWWAFNRSPKTCALSYSNNFVPGRDHTGNKNGAMLIVNVAGKGNGEPIYEQDMKFEMCGSHKYKFTIYAASVSYSAMYELKLSNLGLYILNIKDPANPEVIDSISTGDLNLWEPETSGNNNLDGTHTFDKKPWSEFSIEFTAKEGDVLRLQVLNNCEGGIGNDFVLDDISLYRYDDTNIPEPDFVTKLSGAENGSTDDCEALTNFSIKNPEFIINEWKGIDDYAYFLWQSSPDNGLTWKNNSEGSGINKTSFNCPFSQSNEVVRLIIAGGATPAAAQTEAEYISANGAPSNGCVNYSISSMLTPISEQVSCDYSPALRTIWKEDFGTIDSFGVRAFDAIGEELQIFDTTLGTPFGQNHFYAVTCLPEPNLVDLNADGGTPEQRNFTNFNLSGSTGKTNDAFLLTNVDSYSSEKTVIRKTIPAKALCSCRNMIFRFLVFLPQKTLNALTIEASAITGSTSSVLGEKKVNIKGKTGDWIPVSFDFKSPSSNNREDIHLVITITNSNNTIIPVAFDEFSLSICMEDYAQAEIGIDNDPDLKYYGRYNCEDPNESHTISLFLDSDWDDYANNIDMQWQTSKDGIHWEYVRPSNPMKHDNQYEGALMYRAILSGTAGVAGQVAENGYPDDPCDNYYITSPVTISCKKQSCKEPNFKAISKLDSTICQDGGSASTTWSVKQTDNTEIDSIRWYAKKPTETQWTVISGEEKTQLSIPAAEDTTQYLFLAWNQTCPSDSIIFQLNVNPSIQLEEWKDTVICGNEIKMDIKANATSGNPTTYYWNEDETNGTTSNKLSIQNQGPEYNISVKATDGICTSNTISRKIEILQPAKLKELKDSTVCPGFILDIQPQGSFDTLIWVRTYQGVTDTLKALAGEAATTGNTIPVDQSGIYTAYIASSVCHDSKSTKAEYTLEDTSGIHLSIQDKMICQGQPFTLEATFGEQLSNISWEKSTDGNNFLLFSQELVTTIKDSIDMSTYYRIKKASSGICSDSYSNTIIVEPSANVSVVMEKDMVVQCEGSVVLLAPSITAPNDEYQYEWKNGETTLTSDSINLEVSPKDTITYKIIVSNQCGADTAARTIIGIPAELSLAIDKKEMCQGDSIALTPTFADGLPVIWEMSTDSVNFASFDPTTDSAAFSPSDTTYYRIRTDSNLCAPKYSNIVSVDVERRASVSIDTLPDWICDGVEVNLYVRTDLDTTINTYAWVVNDDTIPQRPMIYMVRDPFRWLDRKPKEDDSLFFKVTETPLIATSYQFVVFGNLCAPVKDSTHTVVYTEHGVELFIDKDTICKGEPVRVTAEYDTNAVVVWQRTYDKITYEDFEPDEIPTDLVKRPGEGPKIRPTANLRPDATTYYRIKVPESDLCPTTFSFTVIAHVEGEKDSVVVEPIPPIVCAGTSVNLKAASATENELSSYAWIKDGDTLSTTEMELTDTPTRNTSYEFVTGNHCGSGSTKLEVKVENEHNIALDIDKQGICAGEMARLIALYDETIEVIWEKSEDSVNFTEFNPRTDVSALLPTSTTYYRLKSESESNICPIVYSNIVSVDVEQKINVEVDSIPSYFCEGTSLALQANATLDPNNTFAWLRNGDTLSTTELAITDTPTESSTYKLVINGVSCPSFEQSFGTEIEKKPKLSLALSDAGACEGSEFSLIAETDNILGMEWQRKVEGESEFSTFGNDMADEKSLTAEKTSTYRILSTGNQACSSDTSEEMTLVVEEKITFELQDKQVICPKKETVVDAHFSGTPKSVTWEKREKGDDDFSLFSNTTDPFTLSPSESAEYMMKFTMDYCPSGEAYFIVVVDKSEDMEITPDDSICQGESIRLKVSSEYPETIVWASAEEGSSEFTEIQGGVTEIEETPTATTRYKVTSTTKYGCPMEPAYTSVKVSEPVDITLFGGGDICYGDSLNLHISGLNDYSEIMWLTSFDNFGSSENGTTTYYAKPSSTTEYRAVVRNGMCEGEASTTINVHFPPKVISCEEYGNTSYIVETESEDTPLYFDFGDGRAITTSNILSNVNFGATYEISISNEIGCTSTYLLETPTYDLVFPEYFIQDKETWRVENLDRYEKATYEIFDRFGKKIFEGSSSNDGWDGTYIGNKMPSSDYWYIINIPEIDRQFQGHFTLLRE